MEFRQLEYFMEVAKREHMTDAAEELHVSQSSVSRSIYNLEEELGVKLFIREGRNVRLTPTGQIFLERATQIYNLAEESKREVKELLNPYSGTVRIAFPISMAAHTLPSIIYAFRKKYPNAKFEMNNALFNDLIGGVKKGDYNMAITAPIPSDEQDVQIKSRTLFREEIVALLPLHHPLAKRKSISLLELKDDPFCILPESYMFHQLVLDSCQNAGFEPEIAFEGTDIDALKGLVSAGLGVALMPEMTLIDNIPRTATTVRINDPVIHRPVGVIIPTQRTLLPTEQLFYDFLHEYFERLDQFRA
ncbi:MULTISPECIES: LysR family transcriptional regulator [Allobacillus]|uniref:LysR family transcriptional regulator n=1 Tax=Allobacillus salarius TaxID=1955272 RepID=A0A556PBI9_9BACI|nr:LysR family transcriptional regulator [Allobacillus salarius]TSJ61764.1 LysR family transcriptional regulator [Allobacillus salarius]